MSSGGSGHRSDTEAQLRPQVKCLCAIEATWDAVCVSADELAVDPPIRS
jgi:hypothetical protein